MDLAISSRTVGTKNGMKLDKQKRAGAPLADRRRKWSMRGLVIVIALSPFLLLEAGLRHFAPPAAGADVPDPLIQLQQSRPLFVLDRDSGLWHISPQRRGLFRPASFLANKPTGTRRIFVLGE